MSKQPSLFGGACIIASVCVGAGMLGLPSAGAGAWTCSDFWCAYRGFSYDGDGQFVTCV